MSARDQDKKLSPAEVAALRRLEAIAQDGLSTYTEVAGALAAIRDRQLHRETYQSFDTYLRERWGITVEAGMTPAGALAKACEQTLRALDRDELAGLDIRVTVRKQPTRTALGVRPDGDPEVVGTDELVALRSLMSQAGGVIAAVAHQLETRGDAVDDKVRDQLRDDVDVLDEELGIVKALLLAPSDWDEEFGRLLDGEVPRFEDTSDAEGDDGKRSDER